MTVNHLVPGSIPGAGAIQSQTPYLSCLNNINTEKNHVFTTLLQQYDDIILFLNNDSKYLQKIGDIYYFVLRKNRKIIKKSLKTSNARTANIRKLKILKGLNKMDYIQPLNKDLKVITIIEDGDDEEEAKKVIKSINRTANNKVDKTEKINSLTTEIKYENTYKTIKEEAENFFKYCYKTKSDIEERTILDYKSSFKYLYLKFPCDTKIYNILNFEDWDNYRDFLITLPNNVIRRYGSSTHGTDVEKIIEKIENEYEEKNEVPKLLTPRTINKHFNVFSMFLDYLETTQKINKNPIKNIKELVEYPNPYLNYSEEDLQKLFSIKDETIKNFFKIALYSGLRLSAIISIKKDDIDLKNNKLIVPKDKTTNGKRTIIIHKKIKNIFKNFIDEEREYLFFNTDSKDKIQKKINPLIFDVLGVKKTIHGFRKNFTIELYKHTDDNNFRKYIVGHSQKSDITFTTYNLENIDFNKMSQIINKIEYNLKKTDEVEKLAQNLDFI